MEICNELTHSQEENEDSILFTKMGQVVKVFCLSIIDRILPSMTGSLLSPRHVDKPDTVVHMS